MKKVVTRHIYGDAIDRANELRLSRYGKKTYKCRSETVERSFADAKQHHGHRYARFRGLTKVQMQCWLAAAAQNIKKIALVMSYLLKIGLNRAEIAQILAFIGFSRFIELNNLSQKKYRDRGLRPLQKQNPTQKGGVRQQSERLLRGVAFRYS